MESLSYRLVLNVKNHSWYFFKAYSRKILTIMRWIYVFRSRCFRGIFASSALLYYEKRAVFYTSEKGLKSKLGNPMSGVGTINLHVWLTTPNMEIIDLKFATTYGIVNNIPSIIGRC